MSFRFIHTADLHLDSPLRSLALRAPDAAEAIGLATRTALVRTVDLCLEHQADALLIAGDLYDGDQTSMKTARFLARELRRLDAGGIRVFIIRGNHDALSRITRELTLPGSVHVFGARPNTERLEVRGMDVAIHGLSYSKPRAAENLLARYPAPVSDALNIGMLHTSLGGALGHDTYAPCSLAELKTTGYDYWALGHIHQRAEYPGQPHVVMPGNPQGRDIGEAGPRSVTLVDMEADGSVRTTVHETMTVEFARVEISLSNAEDWTEVVRALEAAVHDARRRLRAEHLILRPAFTGGSPLHWRLRRDRDLLKAEADMIAEGLGSVWIDKVEMDVTGPTLSGTGPMGEVAALLSADAPPSHASQVRADEALESLRKSLPPSLRNLLDRDGAPDPDLRDELLSTGALDILYALNSRTVAD